MRRIARRIAILLSLLAAAGAAAVTDSRTLAPQQALHLRIDAGEVTVRPGEAGNAAVDAALAPGQRLVWRESADRLVLLVDDRERLSPRPVTLQLRVPADASLVLDIGIASLDLDGAGGNHLVVRGGRGNVRITSVSPRIDIETGAGRIEARVGGARLRTNSVAGAQRIALSGSGTVHAATVSGAMDVGLDTGVPIRLSSVSGRVDLTLAATEGLDARVDTLSADVGIRVLGGQPFSATIAQARGRVSVPAAIAREADGSLRFGEGGGRLHLASFSGAIDIEAPTATATTAPAPAEPPDP
jgi:hypothetical protein